MTWEPRLPQEIEAESFRRIAQAVGRIPVPPPEWQVLRRLLHTSADLDYVNSVRFHPEAVAAGVAALKAGGRVFTDTRMLLAGISTGRLARLGVKAACMLDEPGVADAARNQATTRSAAAVDLALPQAAGGIVAIGNAPTALLRLLEVLAAGASAPALIIGLPVGWVNAAEAKEALTLQNYPYITALGLKGGSAAAASVVNALAILALEA